MEPIYVQFYVQVDPCPLEALDAVIESDKVEYLIGSGELRTQAYQFIQTPASCNYIGEYLSPDLPSFMTWDPETLELVINTDDEGNIGEYFVTL